jgi:hypothetical protein
MHVLKNCCLYGILFQHCVLHYIASLTLYIDIGIDLFESVEAILENEMNTDIDSSYNSSNVVSS